LLKAAAEPPPPHPLRAREPLPRPLLAPQDPRAADKPHPLRLRGGRLLAPGQAGRRARRLRRPRHAPSVPQ
jgi:hypothetical protein